MRPHHTRSAGAGGPTYIWHPSYSNPTTTTEGRSYSYNVQTTNVPNGTTLYWSITHGTTSSADFSANSGFFSVISNLGTFNITPIDEGSYENNETFTLNVRTESISGPIVLTRNITLANVPIYYQIDATTPMEEGNAYNVSVYAYNIPTSTTSVIVSWDIIYISAGPSDFDGSTSGSLNLVNYGGYWYGYFTIFIRNDGITESPEQFYILLFDSFGTIVAQSDVITIEDYNPWVYYGYKTFEQYGDVTCFCACDYNGCLYEIEYNQDTGQVRFDGSTQVWSGWIFEGPFAGPGQIVRVEGGYIDWTYVVDCSVYPNYYC
jgi:hypothetical protein